MQVFMPYPDFKQSVQCLDNKRLGNQAYLECKVLVDGKWKNHPASKIWLPHRKALADYALEALFELWRRGRKYQRWIDYFADIAALEDDTGLPSLIGYEPYHASHRSQLLKKNPEWYGQFGWEEEPGALEYVWSLSDTCQE